MIVTGNLAIGYGTAQVAGGIDLSVAQGEILCLLGANGAVSGVTPATVGATAAALLAITAGTLYQKRFVTRRDLVGGAVWQYFGALALVGAGSLAFETQTIDWTPKFLFALAWLTLALSIGAILLLMLLIRQHAVSGVSSLFYLVPACTAVMAYLMFGETLTVVQIVGMAVAIAGVILVAHNPGARGR